jgi:hypothetical protein
LEDFLKHSINEIDGNELLDLRHIHRAIKDGVATRGDYFRIEKTEARSSNADALSEVVGSAAAPSTESTTNQEESDTTQNDTPNITSDSKKSSTSKYKKSDKKSEDNFDLK